MLCRTGWLNTGGRVNSFAEHNTPEDIQSHPILGLSFAPEQTFQSHLPFLRASSFPTWSPFTKQPRLPLHPLARAVNQKPTETNSATAALNFSAWTFHPKSWNPNSPTTYNHR